jgi:glycosyltransferase involved in cell wall biosynthesis
MKLSIITINLNNKNGLSETISSVIAQTFTDYEYIIVDGQSTDGSLEVIKQNANHINQWISENDHGIYNAMNKGLNLAKGEYCLFLNSGDSLYDSDVLQVLFSQSFTEDIISGGIELYSHTKKWYQFPPHNISLFTFINGSLPHPGTFIRRELLNKLGGYNENYRIISDWCFFVDALIVQNCSYKYYDITVSKFNCFGISSTSSSTEDVQKVQFLRNRFPKMADDYDLFNEESVFNSFCWLKYHPIIKVIIVFPFKILNRILHLRNRLKKRIIVLDKLKSDDTKLLR